MWFFPHMSSLSLFLVYTVYKSNITNDYRNIAATANSVVALQIFEYLTLSFNVICRIFHFVWTFLFPSHFFFTNKVCFIFFERKCFALQRNNNLTWRGLTQHKDCVCLFFFFLRLLRHFSRGHTTFNRCQLTWFRLYNPNWMSSLFDNKQNASHK